MMADLQENYKVVANAYPIIGKKIKLFWGHQEFTDLMNDLMYNTRDNSGPCQWLQYADYEMDPIRRSWNGSYTAIGDNNKVFPEFREKSIEDRALSHRQTDDYDPFRR